MHPPAPQHNGDFVARTGDVLPQFRTMPHCDRSDHDQNNHDYEGFFGIGFGGPRPDGFGHLDIRSVEFAIKVRLFVIPMMRRCISPTTNMRWSTITSGITPPHVALGSALDWQRTSLALLIQRVPFLHRLGAHAGQVHAVCVHLVFGVAMMLVHPS